MHFKKLVLDFCTPGDFLFCPAEFRRHEGKPSRGRVQRQSQKGVCVLRQSQLSSLSLLVVLSSKAWKKIEYLIVSANILIFLIFRPLHCTDFKGPMKTKYKFDSLKRNNNNKKTSLNKIRRSCCSARWLRFENMIRCLCSLFSSERARPELPSRCY